MAKTKPQKEAILAAYQAKLGESTGFFIIKPTGLKPNDVNDFKKKLTAIGSTFTVVKNTLFAKALKDANLPEFDTLQFGENAVMFINQDIANTAKLLKEFAKEQKDKVEIRAGVIEGNAITGETVNELADLPTMEQSISMIVGLINQSLAGVTNVLEDSVRSVAVIIDQAFKDK